jgi:hypothetical protein
MTDDKTWTKNSNGFIKKPGKGWLHSDESIQDGITYNVKVYKLEYTLNGFNFIDY